MASDWFQAARFGTSASIGLGLRLHILAYVCALLLFVSALAAFGAVRRMARAASDVEQTYQVLMTLDDISIGLDQDVNATRGFLLTLAQEFVGSQAIARERVGNALATLEEQIALDPGQLERLSALRPLIESRFDLSDQYVQIRRENDLATTTARIPAGGESLAARVRAAISEMATAERAMLAERRAQASASTTRALVTGAVAGGASLFVLGLALLLLHRRNSQQALAEARFRTLFETAPDALVATDREGRIRLVNAEAERVFGYSRDELVNLSIETVIPGVLVDAGPELQAPERAPAAAKAAKSASRDMVGRRKDGTECSVAVCLTPLGSEAQTPFLVSVRDITERKRRERALIERETQLKAAQRMGHVGSYTFDIETGACSWTEEMYRITGRDLSLPAPGLDEWLAMLTPESQAAFRESVAGYEADRQAFEIELELVRPDGGHRWVVLCSGLNPEAADRPNQVIGVIQDVTERRQMEERLQQAQRVEGIGRLAAGVAHDFNNLLTPIVGFSSGCLDRLAEGDPMREDLVEIQKAAEMAAGLARQILAVGRRQLSRPEVLDLGDVVQKTTKLLQRLLGEHISIECCLQLSPAAVNVDRGQIEQILTNLAVNARDAMPKGGTLTIETADVILDRAYARTHPGIKPGPYVMLMVRDTGHGMPQEALSQVFDPFYTTKELGSGTGLGLAIVYGILQQSGGSVDVESALGRGTTFRLYFPAVSQALAPNDAIGPPPRGEAPGRKTILLVEDNDAVRRFARRALAHQGYEVLDARTGDDALRLIADRSGAFDLLLTDVVMPDMSGPELANKLAATVPNLKVLYMSGYTDDAIGSRGVLAPGVAFLAKPFTPGALVQKVREVLEVQVPAADGVRSDRS